MVGGGNCCGMSSARRDDLPKMSYNGDGIRVNFLVCLFFFISFFPKTTHPNGNFGGLFVMYTLVTSCVEILVALALW